MKKEKLMDAIGEIDEKLIDSADASRNGKKTKKIRWQKILIAAACVILAAVMTVTLALNFGGAGKGSVRSGDGSGTEAPLDGEFRMKTREGSVRSGSDEEDVDGLGEFYKLAEPGRESVSAVKGSDEYYAAAPAPGDAAGTPFFPTIEAPTVGDDEEHAGGVPDVLRGEAEVLARPHPPSSSPPQSGATTTTGRSSPILSIPGSSHSRPTASTPGTGSA